MNIDKFECKIWSPDGTTGMGISIKRKYRDLYFDKETPVVFKIDGKDCQVQLAPNF
ncbi:MAG: hypothetical protein ACTSVV_12900 [Promethearchaeota archaeon]